jgi:hypothetical protein
MVKRMSDIRNLGNPEDIYFLLSPAADEEDFCGGLSIRYSNSDSSAAIGLTELGEFFLALAQPEPVVGFNLKRARLEGDRLVAFADSIMERAIILRCFAVTEDELLAISSLFAGLIELFRDSPVKAMKAAQAYEDYFGAQTSTVPSLPEEVGLFGELCAISKSTSIPEMVSGWHSSPFTTYDFSIGGKRLEVKTSTRPQRIHWLRNSQSGKHSDVNLTYLSIYAPEDAQGLTVDHLVENIRRNLDSSVEKVFDSKLMPFETSNFQRRFDFIETEASFRFFQRNAIPSPIVNSPDIIDVQWKVDFSRIGNFDSEWHRGFNP